MKATSKRTKRALPSICVDEHLSPRVVAAFRSVFRTIEAGKHRAFRGRDERDYLPRLYRENALFVTSDAEFVTEINSRRIRHPGIIYIPNRIAEDEKVIVAQIVGVFVKVACSSSRFAIRNRILFPAYDGLRSAHHFDRDELEFSWEWCSRQLN